MMTKTKPTIRAAFWLYVVMFLSLFTSSVTCFAGSNIPVTVDIPLQYVINNQAALEKEGKNVAVTFTLTAADDITPMPDGKLGGSKSVTLTKSGKTSFGPITYERPDIYEYTVVRKSDAKVSGLKEDVTEFRVSVCALNDGNGSIIIKKVGNDGKSELIYADTFKSASGTKTGDETPMIYYVNIILAAILLLLIVWNIEDRRKWLKESQRDR